MNIAELQELLTAGGAAFDTEKPEGSDGICQIVTKATDTAAEGPCGEACDEGCAGLCEKHYKEYLGTLIRREKVDPVLTMNKHYCMVELHLNEVDFDSNLELDGLREVIAESVPLVYI